MQYFSTLPKVIYSDKNKVSKVFTNLLARAKVKPSLLTNPLIFYTYDVQDGETPEIIADKYYGDSYRYWLVTMVNNILDPQWDWPMSGRNFEDYIAVKYTDVNPYNTAHHYEKVITQYESATQTTTVNRIEIDEDTYNNLIESTNSYNFSSETTTVSITKKLVTLYQYESDLNESKRTIKLLKKQFATKIEQNLSDLMK